MVAVVEALAVIAIVLVNSAVAALMTRFFRVRLDTAWGSFLYALVFCPVVLALLLVALSVLFALAGVRPDLGGRAVGYAVTIAVPFAVGITFDYFWMPAPEEVDLPESTS